MITFGSVPAGLTGYTREAKIEGASAEARSRSFASKWGKSTKKSTKKKPKKVKY